LVTELPQSSAPIRCQRCRDVCKGEVVRVQDTHFHVKCFTCTVCGCDLARSGFFQKRGEYICTSDYQRLYGRRCDRCDGFISGEVVSALGRTYHPTCFVCSVCRKQFPIGDRVTFSGKACVCQQCSHTLVNSNEPIKIHGPSHCGGCGEVIKQGQSLLALEKQWHVSCFKCHTCNMVLTGEYISKDKVPYCEADYHAQFGIKCETCRRYISGRVLEAGGKHYHPACARCAQCHMMFTEGEEMYLHGGEVWHPLCKQAVRAERRLRHRRLSETSISPPGSSICSPSRVVCELSDHMDFRQRRCSSTSNIDSPSLSRQTMSPVTPRSHCGHPVIRMSTDNLPATKSRTSEDIIKSSRLSAYSPEPCTQSESNYYPYTSSPKASRGPRRRYSTGVDEENWSDGSLQRIQSGIGRMILKEEMKARSGSYDNDPWGSTRNSQSSSKETLNTTAECHLSLLFILSSSLPSHVLSLFVSLSVFLHPLSPPAPCQLVWEGRTVKGNERLCSFESCSFFFCSLFCSSFDSSFTIPRPPSFSPNRVFPSLIASYNMQYFSQYTICTQHALL
uniref:LIM zinc-binding domain-containing protein n=1 Tax=Esox lucius TaxID=8010 RepID=A0A6Q2ZF23_ESOLU